MFVGVIQGGVNQAVLCSAFFARSFGSELRYGLVFSSDIVNGYETMVLWDVTFCSYC